MEQRLNETADGHLLVKAAGGIARHVLPPQERRFGHNARALCGHQPANTAVTMKRRGKWYHSTVQLVPRNVTCAKCASLFKIAIERGTVMKQRVKLKMLDVVETTTAPVQAELHLYLDDSCKGVTFDFDPNVTAYTPWSKDKPPAIGLWDVRRSGSDKVMRWWFGGVWWKTTDNPSRDYATAGGMSHDQFAASYLWRGLAEKPLQDYACPPYDLRTVPKGAQLAVWVPAAPKRTPTRAAG